MTAGVAVEVGNDRGVYDGKEEGTEHERSGKGK